jgi:ankyrin repeat protein
MLIERGADPNLGKPLHLRVEDEDVEAARALLEAGADPNLKSEDGDLLLEMAMEQDDTALFALLLDHGAKFGGHKPPPGLSAEQKKLLAEHGVAAAPRSSRSATRSRTARRRRSGAHQARRGP